MGKFMGYDENERCFQNWNEKIKIEIAMGGYGITVEIHFFVSQDCDGRFHGTSWNKYVETERVFDYQTCEFETV